MSLVVGGRLHAGETGGNGRRSAGPVAGPHIAGRHQVWPLFDHMIDQSGTHEADSRGEVVKGSCRVPLRQAWRGRNLPPRAINRVYEALRDMGGA